MKLNFKRFTAGLAALLIGTTSGIAQYSIEPTLAANAVYGTGNNIVEYLDRGISAVKTDSGMLVSWRFLANDADNAVFKLYRDNTLVYTSNAGDATCYLDAGGSSSSVYRVDTVTNNIVTSSSKCTIESGNSYLDVKLDIPTSSSCTYSPNDCSVGDVDGDGEYELFVKWDPSNSQDNSKSGKTDKVYIDCYKLNGTKLWRIDLGYNIRAGAHYTQFLVADYDCDGYAEMTCKTADGTVDGQGNVIGDGSKVYRNSKGYILTGPEYYTLFDGLTGKALDTVDYNPGRGTVSSWGDSYGNRCDRFLGAVAYLDGVHPSAVTIRGYYTRMTACAYDVVDKKLVERWYFDTGNNSSAAGYGDGNHNCMPADVDNDGKQEIVLGATCLDDNGKILWCTNSGHGDAMHLGDFLPDRTGLEVWICHEDKPYGVTLLDASNGKTIFHVNGDTDTGRCCADNVWAGNDGAEFWGHNYDVYNGSGSTLSCNRPAVNFLSYWDGDLEREILDGYTDSPATISKMGSNGKLTTLLSTDGYYTCNTTKGTPCLSADIFGDWREELVVRAADGKSIRIYCTTFDTDYRITTLMHDVQYRTQVAGENVTYNQPPHASFYLGSDEALPDRPAVTVNGESSGTTVKTGATMDTINKYMFKNVGSGLYLEVAGSVGANGTNVQQGEKSQDSGDTWQLASAGNGYYYIYSMTGDGKTYLLDLDYGKTDNGTNIGIYSNTNSDAQLFKFVRNDDGTYTITTKATSDASCLGVSSDSTEVGANVLQWECSGADSQKWVAEKITTKDGTAVDESFNYMIKNVNSGLYMEVEGGTKADGTNVQQWGANSSASHNTWSIASSGTSGYYYIYSLMGDGKTYYLDVADGKSSSGTNIQIWTENLTSSQLFKFSENSDGTYTIFTKASKDNCCLEVADSSTGSGANVQQAVYSMASNQKWKLEAIEKPIVVTTTTTTVTTTTVTTTTTTITTAATTVVEKNDYGNANCDDEVSIADAIMILQYISDPIGYPISAEGLKNADVYLNGDGVNAQDALSIQKLLAKQLTELPESFQ